jgi:microcystin-dependent protein
MSIISMAIMSMTTLGFKATKSSTIRLDIQDIRRKITSTLDCKKTFQTYGASRPIACTGAVVLKNNGPSTNNAIVPSEGKLAGWNIEARCEVLEGQNGLSIYATKRKPGGGYLNDPVLNYPLDETSPISLIFSPGVRPCASYFGGPDDSPVPLGGVFYIAGATAPDGFLVANGDRVPNGNGTVQGKTADFSGLYSVLGSTYGSPGRLPDLRGEFIRGLDSGRGVDTARTLGSAQLDQFQGHTNIQISDPWSGAVQMHFQAWSSEGSGTASGGGAAMRQKNVWNHMFEFGGNGAPRYGPETRPRNVALIPVIKY